MMFAALSYSLVEIAIAVVIVAAICGLVFIALRQFQVPVPPWIWHVFWIIVVAVVIIFAIRFVASL